jgi:hypothetical protein
MLKLSGITMTTTRLAPERSYCGFDLTGVVNGICPWLHPERPHRGLQWSPVISSDVGGRFRIEQKRDPRNAGRYLLEHFRPLADHRRFEIGEAGNVPARMRQVRNKAGADWIGNLHEHDRYGAGLFPQCENRRGGVSYNHFGLQSDKLFRKSFNATGIAGAPATINSKIDAVHPSQFLKRLIERPHHRLRFRIALGNIRQQTDPPYTLGLLRLRRERPGDRRAAKQRDELAPST